MLKLAAISWKSKRFVCLIDTSRAEFRGDDLELTVKVVKK